MKPTAISLEDMATAFDWFDVVSTIYCPLTHECPPRRSCSAEHVAHACADVNKQMNEATKVSSAILLRGFLDFEYDCSIHRFLFETEVIGIDSQGRTNWTTTPLRMK